MRCSITIQLRPCESIYVECDTLSELLEAIKRIDKFKKDLGR